MRSTLLVLLVILIPLQSVFAQEVIFEPVQGDIDLDNNGEYGCLIAGNNICVACVGDIDSPQTSVPPLIISFGQTGLFGWSEGTMSGTVRPFVEVDGVTVLPSLLPSGAFFRSNLAVGEGFVPNRPCPDQGLDYQIGSLTGSVVGGGLVEINIPAEDAEVVTFNIDFCSVSAHWGAGCSVNGSINNRWLLHLPAELNAVAVGSGNSDPLEFASQGITLDFEQSPGGAVTVLRSEDPAPVGPPLNGPTGYWEVKTDMLDGTFAAVVTVDFDPASLPSGLDPTALRLARFDAVADGWESLPSTVDVGAGTVTATTTAFSVMVLTTDNPVATTTTSWGAMKAQY